MNVPTLTRVKVLGLGHRARQGKDVAVRAIEAAVAAGDLDFVVRRFAFGDAIKAHCRMAHRMEEKNPTLLQRIGARVREGDGNAWIRVIAWAIADWDAEIDPNDNTPRLAIVSDVRFLDEVALVRQMGGKMVRVVRQLRGGGEYRDPERDHSEASETTLDGYAYDDEFAALDGEPEVLAARAVDYVDTYMSGDADLEPDDVLISGLGIDVK